VNFRYSNGGLCHSVIAAELSQLSMKGRTNHPGVFNTCRKSSAVGTVVFTSGEHSITAVLTCLIRFETKMSDSY
jgi:hypothetical protein